MAEPNYDIDKEAIESEVNAERDTAIKESDAAYDSIIDENNKTKDGLLSDIEANQKRQEEIANKNTEFAIEEINQNKENTRKDYIKEQSGAYKDWQKQSDPYGVNAEQRASMGMANTGYSESAQVSMYNQYQNRVATARESYVRAVQNYDNAITQARLQNSSILAEIAAEALAKSLEVSLNFASQNNAILTEKVRQRTEIDNNYYNRYLAVLDQINKENSLAESVRQHNDSMALEREKFNWQKEQANNSSSGGGSGKITKTTSGSDGGSGASIEKNTEKETSKESSGPKVNTDSLVKAGLAGASAETIDKEIRAGRLIEYEQDGQLYYRRVYFPMGLGLR